jgi:RNA polymerase sigma-70 factor (ECF subfamily)
MWSEFHMRVNGLSDDHKEIVNLLFYEGLSQDEAATLLDVSLRTVKRRWQEAKILLQEQISDGSG